MNCFKYVCLQWERMGWGCVSQTESIKARQKIKCLLWNAQQSHFQCRNCLHFLCSFESLTLKDSFIRTVWAWFDHIWLTVHNICNQPDTCLHILGQIFLVVSQTSSSFSNRVSPTTGKWEEHRWDQKYWNISCEISWTLWTLVETCAHAKRLTEKNRFSGPVRRETFYSCHFIGLVYNKKADHQTSFILLLS